MASLFRTALPRVNVATITRGCAGTGCKASSRILIPRGFYVSAPTQLQTKLLDRRAFSVVSGGRLAEIKKYTTDHEWVRLDSEDSDIATIGITTHAQSSLGDIVYIELPILDQSFSVSETLGTVESVKSASDILSPVTGTVVEVNEVLPEKPKLVNEDAEGVGWMVRMKVENKSELDGLMSLEEYEVFKKGGKDEE